MKEETCLDCERLLKDERKATGEFVRAEAAVDRQIRAGAVPLGDALSQRNAGRNAETRLRDACSKTERHARSHCSK